MSCRLPLHEYGLLQLLLGHRGCDGRHVGDLDDPPRVVVVALHEDEDLQVFNLEEKKYCEITRPITILEKNIIFEIHLIWSFL